MAPLDIGSVIPWWDIVQYGISQTRTYAQRRQLLGAVEDAIKTSNKLRPSVAKRLSDDFKENGRVRDGLMSVNNELEIMLLMTYYSSDYLPYKVVAPDITKIFTAQKVMQHPDYITTESYSVLLDVQSRVERIEMMMHNSGQNSHAIETLKSYDDYAKGAYSRVKTDPMGASRDFLAETLQGKGIKRYVMDVEEGSYEVEYMPSTMNISAQGETARKLMRLYDDAMAGRQFRYTFDQSDDFEVTRQEYGPNPLNEVSKPERLEIWSGPHEIERRLILSSEVATVTLDVILAHDELEGYFTMSPARHSEHFDFRIKAPTHGGIANLKIDLKVAAQAPERVHLPLFRFFAALQPESRIAFIDEDTELEFWAIDLQSMSDEVTAREIAYSAAYLRDFSEVDHWLRFKEIAPQGLTWPIKQSSHADVGALLKAMAETLKHGELIRPASYTFTSTDISKSAYDVKIENGVLLGANFIAKTTISLNNDYICDNFSTLTEPQIKLSRDGIDLKPQRFGDVFPSEGNPVKIEVSHDQSRWTLEKPGASETEDTD